MQIAIGAVLFDPAGHVTIHALPASQFGGLQRRVTKSQTLDGGVSVVDNGFSWSDKEYALTWQTKARDFEAIVAGLIQNHSRVTVSSHEGCFLAVPLDYDTDFSESTATFSIIKRLDA